MTKKESVGIGQFSFVFPTTKDVLLLRSRQKEAAVLNWFNANLMEGMTFLDIGANVGEYSLYASQKVGKSGLVYSLEPRRVSYKLLKKIVSMNSSCKNVKLFRFGAAGNCGKALLKGSLKEVSNPYYGKSRLVSAKRKITSVFFQNPKVFFQRKHIYEKVRVVTIDCLVRNRRIKVPDIVKIDVEGHELEVLRGMNECMKEKMIQYLLLEVQECNLGQIDGFMAKLNYHRQENLRFGDPGYFVYCKNNAKLKKSKL